MKNGILYDEVHFPITSLEPLTPLPIWGPHDPYRWNDPLLVDIWSMATRYWVEYHILLMHFHSYAVYSFQSSMRTLWSEQFSHTFTVDGNAGDHIEIRAHNRIIFDFPVPHGHYSRYNIEGEYDTFDPLPTIRYKDNDGIHVNINSGNVIIVQSPN